MFQINLPTTDEYISNKNYNCLYVKHNDSLRLSCEIIDVSIAQIKNDNLIKLNEIDIYNYFNNILEYRLGNEHIFNNISEYINIHSINGYNLSYYESHYNCSYCKSYIDNNYFYCLYCHKNICNGCYTDTIHCNIDHKRKIKSRLLATSKNYLLYCDGCDVVIIKQYYSKKVQDNTYDLCIKCYNNKPDQELEKYEYILPADNCNFGTIIDWIPILKDNKNDLLLLNKNTFEYCIAVKCINGWYYYILELKQITQNMKLKDPKEGIFNNLLNNLYT